MIVYLLLNTINFKGYVGKHKGEKISSRWPKNLNGGNCHLRGSRDKYGSEAFSKEILGYCNSVTEMNNLERLWILTLRTYDPEYGYNMTYGGDSGEIPTEETKIRMRKKKSIPSKRIGGCWITDGKEDSFLLATQQIPEGWIKGYSHRWHHKQESIEKQSTTLKNFYKDPVNYEKVVKSILRAGEIQRSKEGWIEKKRVISNLNFLKNENHTFKKFRFKEAVWVTDGKNNRRIKKDEVVPIGWKLGVTRVVIPEDLAFAIQKRKATITRKKLLKAA